MHQPGTRHATDSFELLGGRGRGEHKSEPSTNEKWTRCLSWLFAFPLARAVSFLVSKTGTNTAPEPSARLRRCKCSLFRKKGILVDMFPRYVHKM